MSYSRFFDSKSVKELKKMIRLLESEKKRNDLLNRQWTAESVKKLHAKVRCLAFFLALFCLSLQYFIDTFISNSQNKQEKILVGISYFSFYIFGICLVLTPILYKAQLPFFTEHSMEYNELVASCQEFGIEFRMDNGKPQLEETYKNLKIFYERIRREKDKEFYRQKMES